MSETYIQDGDIIEDLVVVRQGDKVVARVRARIDLSEVPEEYLGFVFIQRTSLVIPSQEEMERTRLREEEYQRCMDEYRRRSAEYTALPWWKKLFSSRPLLHKIWMSRRRGVKQRP